MSRTVRLGAFIVAALAVLATGSFLIGQREFLFSRTFRVETSFKNVGGLIAGAEVRIGGTHTGVVKSIDLPSQPDGEMRVAMNLERSVRDVVRSDSIASIYTEGLLGYKYVELSFGSPEAAPIADGGRIASEAPTDFGGLLKQANGALSNIQQITDKLNRGEGTFGALINDRKMVAQMNDTAAQAKAGAAAFQENMQALKRNFLLRGFFNSRGYDDETKLTLHEIPRLPAGAPAKAFRYDVSQIFVDAQRAKLKSGKVLKEAGEYLAATPFGRVVIVAAHDMTGDSDEVRVLTQARAMVVRDYLVKNFRMDDTRVKTLGLGKDDETPSGAGTIDILVYAK